jgi:phosphoglucosamine mutase
VKRKPPLEEIPEVQSAIRHAEKALGDQGRVLIRYSGTQSMCRVMVEGPTEELTRKLTESLAATVMSCLG